MQLVKCKMQKKNEEVLQKTSISWELVVENHGEGAPLGIIYAYTIEYCQTPF